MSVHVYQTLENQRLTFSFQDERESEFLSDLIRMAHEPHVSGFELSEQIYSKKNPILDHTIFPDRGTVTERVRQNPLYHIMIDLWSRKRVQEGTLDLNAYRARFTLSLEQAAERLRLTQDQVSALVGSYKLTALHHEDGLRFDPKVLDLYARFMQKKTSTSLTPQAPIEPQPEPDLERRARYTMTVPEAARELDITESAVRQAIAAGKLQSIKNGGQHLLDPSWVKLYRVSKRASAASSRAEALPTSHREETHHEPEEQEKANKINLAQTHDPLWKVVAKSS
jgi:hypothetical protein